MGIFQKVGAGGEKLILNPDMFKYSVRDVKNAVEFIQILFGSETFSAYHVAHVYSLLRTGKPKESFHVKKGRRKRLDVDQPQQTRRYLLSLGFSNEVIKKDHAILRFSEDEIASGWDAIWEAVKGEKALSVEQSTEWQMLNLLRYYVERENKRPTLEEGDVSQKKS